MEKERGREKRKRRRKHLLVTNISNSQHNYHYSTCSKHNIVNSPRHQYFTEYHCWYESLLSLWVLLLPFPSTNVLCQTEVHLVVVWKLPLHRVKRRWQCKEERLGGNTYSVVNSTTATQWNQSCTKLKYMLLFVFCFQTVVITFCIAYTVHVLCIVHVRVLLAPFNPTSHQFILQGLYTCTLM